MRSLSNHRFSTLSFGPLSALLIFFACATAFASVSPDHFNGPGLNPVANWSPFQAGGSSVTFIYTDNATEGIVQDSSDSSPTSIGKLLGDASVTYESVTYTDPVPGAADNFILVDVNTGGVQRNFTIIASDGSKSVTQSTNNLVGSCGTTLIGLTFPNQWCILFIDLTGQGMGNIQTLTVIPYGGSFDQPVYFDNLRSSMAGCSLPTPTATFTFTGGVMTSTPTPTLTPTPGVFMALSPASFLGYTTDVNDFIDYLLTIQNGQSSLSAVTISLNLPAFGASSVSFTQGPAGTMNGSQPVWNLGTLAPNATVTLGLRFTFTQNLAFSGQILATMNSSLGNFFSNNTQMTISPPSTPVNTPTSTAAVTATVVTPDPTQTFTSTYTFPVTFTSTPTPTGTWFTSTPTSTYTPNPAPMISGLGGNPNCYNIGPVTVSVYGTNFVNVTDVSLNGVSVAYNLVSSTLITFPANVTAAQEPVTVTTLGGITSALLNMVLCTPIGTSPTYTSTLTPTPTFTRTTTIIPTNTFPVTFTATDTPTFTGTWYTSTPTNTFPVTLTSTFTSTFTWTYSPTFTDTITPGGPTVTPTYTPTPNFTVPVTFTLTPSDTLTPTSTLPVTFTGTPTPTPVGTPLLVGVQPIVAPASPATLALGDGMTIITPPNAFAQPVTLTVTKYAAGAAPPAANAFQVNFMGVAYLIDAGGQEPIPGSSVTITLPYDPNLIPVGYTPANLTVSFFNGLSWVTLPVTLDALNHTLTVVTDHFSWWSVVLLEHTPTPTATTVTSGPGSKPLVFPNPATGDSVELALPSLTRAGDVKVQVFSLSYRKVQDLTVPNVQPGLPITLDLLDKWGARLSDGLYYIQVTLPNGSKTTLKLLVLR